MNKKLLSLLSMTAFSLLLSLTQGNIPAMAEPLPQLSVPVTNVFLPKGFDTNDNIEVTITGYFPNLCYQSVSHQISIDEQKKEISVNLKAGYLGDLLSMNCVPIVVPYIQTISLGYLEKGNYKVQVNKDQENTVQARTQLTVNEATSPLVDEHIYAQVHYIERVPQNPQMIKLVGENPSSCLALKKVQFISNGVDTYSILPIMKRVSSECDSRAVPFSYEVKVPQNLQQKTILVHVRSMEGKSVNTIIGPLL